MHENDLKGTTLYLDCFAGIAGDMTLGALLDLGVPEQAVREVLAALPFGGWRLAVQRVRKGIIMAVKVHVEVDGAHAHTHAHAHYGDIRRMIAGAGMDPEVVGRALAVFDRIAQAEARVHGVAVEEVAFHEVGAVDSIIDIVGSAAALAWLRPRRVVSRRVALGGGMVRTAHGVLPVPAPATVLLLQGAEVEAGGAEVELTTPTGAAILTVSASAFGPLPAMRILGVGHGAGERELPDRPNLLRVLAGAEPASPRPGSGARCALIEANLDDMNPELCEPLMQGLFALGVRDAWITPVHMKKGRPGLVVSVLCDPDKREEAEALLLRESTTLGVRTHEVTRDVLEREVAGVPTPYGEVLIKVGRRAGEVWNVAPEYESCLAAARKAGVPVKMVYAAALAAFPHGAPRALSRE